MSYKLYLTTLSNSHNEVLMLIGTFDYYDMWVPGTSIFTREGLCLKKYPGGLEPDAYKSFTFIEEFKTVDDFMVWLAKQYFEYLV